LSFLLDENGAVLGSDTQALFFEGDVAQLKDWLQDANSHKIVHDAKTLKLQMCQRDIALQGVTDDAMLMAYLLDPTRQNHPLPALAEKYLRRSLPAKKRAKRAASQPRFLAVKMKNRVLERANRRCSAPERTPAPCSIYASLCAQRYAQ
jgi:DNA polymerase I-like protein with 3'-5' exonuclease and polymerase domains